MSSDAAGAVRKKQAQKKAAAEAVLAERRGGR